MRATLNRRQNRTLPPSAKMLTDLENRDGASVETLPVIVDQHKAIVDAIEIGDVAGAQDAMKKHLRLIFAFLDAAFAAHPEYFEQSGPALSQSMILDD